VFFRSLSLLPASFLLLSGFPNLCIAPQTAHEPSAGERDALAKNRLEKRLAVWQDRLELKDWKVSLILSRRGELRPGTLGNINWDTDTKTARIRILDADEYAMPFEATFSDMEFTLVHELLHLELASLPHTDESRGDEEFAVNRMADALLQLDHRRPGNQKITAFLAP
jgi:hypothetical protein